MVEHKKAQNKETTRSTPAPSQEASRKTTGRTRGGTPEQHSLSARGIRSSQNPKTPKSSGGVRGGTPEQHSMSARGIKSSGMSRSSEESSRHSSSRRS
jgi:hypothetical protein